ncbi:MAG: hypothetical protein R2827_11420 [Bdellovibrionales bacterium]
MSLWTKPMNTVKKVRLGEWLPRSGKIPEDALFLKKAPLDTNAGELSLESGRDYGTLSIRIDRAVRDTQLTEQGVLALYDALSERQSLLNAMSNPLEGGLPLNLATGLTRSRQATNTTALISQLLPGPRFIHLPMG